MKIAVGRAVAFLAERLAFELAARPQVQQQAAGGFGQLGCQRRVRVQVHRSGAQAPSRRWTIASAASSGLVRVVSMRIRDSRALRRGCRCR